MSLNWVWTILSTATIVAELAYPHIIELLNGCINHFWVIGQDASLEVSFSWRFHSHPCASQVSGTDVCNGSVYDNEFEMNSGTQHTLHAIIEDWMLLVILSPCSSWFFGMNQPDLHPFWAKRQSGQGMAYHRYKGLWCPIHTVCLASLTRDRTSLLWFLLGQASLWAERSSAMYLMKLISLLMLFSQNKSLALLLQVACTVLCWVPSNGYLSFLVKVFVLIDHQAVSST